MAEKSQITDAEFERLQQQSASRWSDLITKLKAAEDGEIFTEKLERQEDNGTDRQRARKAIHALSRYHGLQVQLTVRGVDVHVKRIGTVK